MQALDVIQCKARGCIALIVLSVSGYALSRPIDTTPHWVDHPLSPMTGNLVDGASGVRAEFRIDVPVGFIRTEMNSSLIVDWAPTYAFDDFHNPHVTVRLQVAPHSLQDAIDMLPGDQIVRAEALRDGYLITSHNSNKLIRTLTWLRLHDGQSVNCYTMQAARTELPNLDETQAWLEGICRSLVVTQASN